MPLPLSLSTCWNSHRHTDGYAMLKEIADLGFQRAELSHGTKICLIEGILKAVKESVIAISSLHNFCPLPPIVNRSAPNLYQPTSRDPRERELWVKHTLETLDFATKVKAQKVVLHLGSVSFFWPNPIKRLEHYAEDTPIEERAIDDRYVELLTHAVEALRKKSAQTLPLLFDSLEHIMPEANKRNLWLGFENREDLCELPLDDDFSLFFGECEGNNVGYWHDCGHAELKAQFGVIDVADHLAKNGPRLIGCHLHDVVGGKDHRPPGTGTVDFRLLKPYIKEDTTLVLELSPSTEADAVIKSKAYIESILGVS